jgi:hypothetical protein
MYIVAGSAADGRICTFTRVTVIQARVFVPVRVPGNKIVKLLTKMGFVKVFVAHSKVAGRANYICIDMTINAKPVCTKPVL